MAEQKGDGERVMDGESDEERGRERGRGAAGVIGGQGGNKRERETE